MKKIIKWYSETLNHEIYPDIIHLPGNKNHYDFKPLIYNKYSINKSNFIKPEYINIITCATPEYNSILIDQCNYMNINYINAYDFYPNKNDLIPWKNSNKLYIYRNILNKFKNNDIIIFLDSRDILIASFNKLKNIRRQLILYNYIIFGASVYDFPLLFDNDLKPKINIRNLLQSNLNSGVIIGKKEVLVKLFDDAINILNTNEYNGIKLNKNYLCSDQYIFKCLFQSNKYHTNIILDELSNIIFTANGFNYEETDHEIIFKSGKKILI